MAHKSSEPRRLQTRKKKWRTDPGEKRPAPPLELEVERRESPVSSHRHRHRLRRKGEAHELIRRLPAEELS